MGEGVPGKRFCPPCRDQANPSYCDRTLVIAGMADRPSMCEVCTGLQLFAKPHFPISSVSNDFRLHCGRLGTAGRIRVSPDFSAHIGRESDRFNGVTKKRLVNGPKIRFGARGNSYLLEWRQFANSLTPPSQNAAIS